MLNIFSTVFIIDLMCKTNNYRLPLLVIVGVTSTEKTYSVGFAFPESEKEENVTWALEVCQTMLKDKEDTKSNCHRPRYCFDEFGCKSISYFLRITLYVSHHKECEKSS